MASAGENDQHVRDGETDVAELSDIGSSSDQAAAANAGSFGDAMQQYLYTPRRSSRALSSQNEAESVKSNTARTPLPIRRKSSNTRTSPIAPTSSKSPRRGKQAPYKTSAPLAKRYDHLPLVPDIIGPNLVLLFVGFNPGITTATAGHIYAHPSNRFWHLLHVSGLTPERRLSPHEDKTLPETYQYGATNIVARPSKNTNELGAQEWLDGAVILEEKVANWKPEAVCIVGKEIWESIWKQRHGQRLSRSDFHYGWQHESENMGRSRRIDAIPDPAMQDEQPVHTWRGARVFVATSTSGLAAFPSLKDKEAIWKELGDWVQERRQERAREGSNVAAAVSEPISSTTAVEQEPFTNADS